MFIFDILFNGIFKSIFIKNFGKVEKVGERWYVCVYACMHVVYGGASARTY